MWPLQDQSRTRFRLHHVSSQRTSNLKYRLLRCNHRVGWQHHSCHQGFWLAGGTDRGNQRCNVFSTLGSNQSGLSIFVLVTVAALPCIACTSGQLGFALFQVPQLSFPSLLGCKHYGAFSPFLQQIKVLTSASTFLWKSCPPKNRLAFWVSLISSSIIQFPRQIPHTFSSLLLFFTDHAPIPGLHVL